jgi:hypothetical protein
VLTLQQQSHEVPFGCVWFAHTASAGVVAGGVAQVLRQDAGVPAFLGGGTAVWLTIGFLMARHAARGRPLSDGPVWAWATLATYLMT